MPKDQASASVDPTEPAPLLIDPDRGAPSESSLSDLLPWVGLGLILALTCYVYWPAMDGKMLWDDDAHVTKPELRSWDGLRRIWVEIVGQEVPPGEKTNARWALGATQQYYPLLHSFFWLEWQLWGDNMTAYHVANLVLHLITVCLVYLVLRKLDVPGALLAAGIFALHPVHAETVAWVTEQKNTLSAVFYLSSMLAYLYFDESRNKYLYALALTLFTLGLLSKTVTATLPAALLVIFWWKRGRLSLVEDVLPLVPFFVVGAGFGLLTALLEAKVIGAEGEEFELSFVGRCLLAGRVVWFYLGKLLWPADLTFIYPRWSVDPGQPWQWLFPLALMFVFGALIAISGWWRAPLAGALFFVGTLVPVLGFFNVYPFRFSFVADHFQYLASLGAIVLVAAGIVLAIRRLPEIALWATPAVGAALVGVLALVTCYESPKYHDSKTLFQDTIARNPDCWMALNNLGGVLFQEGHTDKLPEIMEYFQKALKLKADYPEALNNLAATLIESGRAQEAIGYLERALDLRPPYADAHVNMGNALVDVGRLPEAYEHYKRAWEVRPKDADSLNGMGTVLLQTGHPEEALDVFQRAADLRPDGAKYKNNVAAALMHLGRIDEAIEAIQQALELQPNFTGALRNLGDLMLKKNEPQKALECYHRILAIDPNSADAHAHIGALLFQTGKTAEGLEEFERAVQINPRDFDSQNNLGSAYLGLNRVPEALEHLQEALRIDPNNSGVHYNLGRLYVQQKQPADAVSHLEHTTRMEAKNVDAWSLLALAYLQTGRIAEGAATTQKALELARAEGNAERINQLQSWLDAVAKLPAGAAVETTTTMPPPAPPQTPAYEVPSSALPPP